VVKVHVGVSWVMTSYSRVGGYKRFGSVYCLRLQGTNDIKGFESTDGIRLQLPPPVRDHLYGISDGERPCCGLLF
jgi:hypothetical protein